ncbi:nicotinamide mononucleotide transporter [Flavisolibacter sp. BT320]|nr:nicotinamide mononucleotide transporter [Flavisolibacter longurius]
MQEFVDQFLQNLQATTPLEYIAVFTGIISVVFSRIENVWVYPTGLVNTIIYIYLSFKYHLIGEASVNFYYTVMSFYGWWLWTRKDRESKPVLHISFSTKKEWVQEIGFFLGFYVAIFLALTYLKQNFFEGVIPWGDAFASATAFTGMWLMARKKVESWWWWILTNMASIPLYYVKGLVFTSVYYSVLLVLAVFGLQEWKRRARATANAATFAVEK